MTAAYTDGSIFVGQPSDTSLTAKNVSAIHNQAVLTGITKRDSGCIFGFCRQNGFSSFASTGGLISAQNRIEMQLDGGVQNSSFEPADLSVSGNLAGARNVIASSVLPASGYIVNDGGRITALNNNTDNSVNAISIDATQPGASGVAGTDPSSSGEAQSGPCEKRFCAYPPDGPGRQFHRQYGPSQFFRSG